MNDPLYYEGDHSIINAGVGLELNFLWVQPPELILPSLSGRLIIMDRFCPGLVHQIIECMPCSVGNFSVK